MVKDMIGREITQGSYVVSYNNIYHVLEVYKNSYMKGILMVKSGSTRSKKLHGLDCCLLPADDIIVWKLKNA